jgi:hypothetical protein
MTTIIQQSGFEKSLNYKTIAKFTLFVFLLVSLVDSQSLSAQENINEIELLNIEFWPDFDQESVLVFLAGTLPPDSSQPATITLPLPLDAMLNVVARVSEQGNLTDDVAYEETTPGEITLTLPNQNFHVEYYLPYLSNDDVRSFDFRWQSEVNVNQLKTTFQQPTMATDISIKPEPARVFTGAYDLQYHESPTLNVPAGTPYDYQASYRMLQPELTAGLVNQDQTAITNDLGAVQINEESVAFNWPIAVAIFGGVIVLGAASWLLYSRRATNGRVAKPRPIRREKNRPIPDRPTKSQRTSSIVRYCHECGQPIDTGDKYCRSCGTPVKNR